VVAGVVAGTPPLEAVPGGTKAELPVPPVTITGAHVVVVVVELLDGGAVCVSR
jgi:hypothetical protein